VFFGGFENGFNNLSEVGAGAPGVTIWAWGKNDSAAPLPMPKPTKKIAPARKNIRCMYFSDSGKNFFKLRYPPR
jgi:hypothetical protein